ncbi:MAG: MarR family winged helix-turn-helix transcriptional regulator [Candidatus Caenarcaniphilales bacterium]|nr:MarR family winged helix-turn-helix transcriptional regulator [Candidatus Caenarcaniphilales bacterium]
MANYIFDPNFQTLSLESKVVTGLGRISEAFRLVLLREAQTSNLTPVQIQILVFMKFHNNVATNIHALSDELNLPLIDIYNEASDLIDKSLIAKKEIGDNHQNVTFSLTARGKMAATKLSLYADKILSQVSNFQKDDLEKFYGYILNLILELQKNDLLSMNRMCLCCKHFSENEEKYSCTLLEKELEFKELRIDCAEHQPLNPYEEKLKSKQRGFY